jgi:signal transduction histidine kinase
MKAFLARYFIILAVLLTVGFDVLEFFNERSSRVFAYSLIESSIDILLIVSAYLFLRKELTERKKSAQKSREANQLKTRLMSMAAHDLRNPLGVVMGYSDLLRQNNDIEAEARSMLEILHRKAGEMNDLINNLLDTSLLEQRGLRLEKEKVELPHAVQEVIDDCRLRLQAKNQRLNFTGRDSVSVWAPPLRLKQILSNLVSNAMKYSPPQSDIHVEMKLLERRVQIHVKDAGPGLTLDERKEVFERFSPVKKIPTGGEASTGLGLSIARSLTEQLEGRLWAESEGPGRGSDFILELPLT